MYYVFIEHIDSGTITRRIKCQGSDERGAERVLRGVNINLNHDEYYAYIEEVDYELPEGSTSYT